MKIKVHYITFPISSHGLKDTHVPRNLSILKVKTIRHKPTMYTSGLILISLNLLQYVSAQADGNPHVSSLDGINIVFILCLELGQDEAM